MNLTRLAESAIVHLGGCDPSRVVLSYDEGGYQPYVTHIEVIPPAEENRPAFKIEGHYFTDLVEATRDFGERALDDARRQAREQVSLAEVRMSGLASRIERVA